MKYNLYRGGKKFIREENFAKIATNNFLAAFGVYLHDQLHFDRDQIIEAYVVIDQLMAQDDNNYRLEKEVGIRLNTEG